MARERAGLRSGRVRSREAGRGRRARPRGPARGGMGRGEHRARSCRRRRQASEIATITDALIEVVEEAHGVTHPLPEHPVSGAAGRRASFGHGPAHGGRPHGGAGRADGPRPRPREPGGARPARRHPPPGSAASWNRPSAPRTPDSSWPCSSAVGQAGSGGLVGVGVDALRHALRAMEADAEAAARAARPSLASRAAPGHRPRQPAREMRSSPPFRRTPTRYSPWPPPLSRVAAGSPGSGKSRRRGAGGDPEGARSWRVRFCLCGRPRAGPPGVVVTDPDAPRRLDRIGIVLLLLDTDALTTGSQLPAHPVALDEDAPSGTRRDDLPALRRLRS